MNPLTSHLLAITMAAALPACQSPAAPRAPDPAMVAESLLVIRNVNVIPIEPAGVQANRSVVIRAGRVAAITAASEPVPPGATVIEGQGRWLMPGLIDAHVHMRRADAPAYLRAGILTVRNMWGHSGIRPLIADIERGNVRGPDIISTSPGLDGTPPQWPETQIVDDPAKADSVVAAQVAAGWQWIKVYQQLSSPVFAAIARSAQQRGARILGHVPTAVPIDSALAAGMLTIEHFTGYDRAVSRTHRTGTWGWTDADESTFPALAAATQRSGTWNVPTLAIYAQLAQQHPAAERPVILQARRHFVAALRAAGARMAAGTDAGINVVAPGTSLLDEIREFEAAGFTRQDALRTATADAADLLGRADLGRLTTGSPAQLVLLNANPLDNLGALANIAGIVRRGTWYRADSIAAAPAPVARTTPRVAGTYNTAVSVTRTTCPNPGIQQFPTVVAQPADTVITLAHAGTTYVGTLRADGTFTTEPKVLQFGATSYRLTITGRFTGGAIDADVRVQQGNECEYTVRWNGRKD